MIMMTFNISFIRGIAVIIYEVQINWRW